MSNISGNLPQNWNFPAAPPEPGVCGTPGQARRHGPICNPQGPQPQTPESTTGNGRNEVRNFLGADL